MSAKRKFQACAPKTIPMKKEDFRPNKETACYWLTSSGVFINSYGTTIMIDPSLVVIGDDPPCGEYKNKEFLVLPPISPEEIEHLDAVLYTHADFDHMGPLTAVRLLPTGCIYYGTNYVARELKKLGIPDDRICIHENIETFMVKDVKVELTRAFHPWQLRDPDVFFGWHYEFEDCCGFRIITRDGIIWAPGDTILLEEHFNNTDVDVIFMDLSDSRSSYHFGRDDAVKLANHLVKAEIVLIHYGTLYNPDHPAFNGNPDDLKGLLVNEERLHVVPAGWKYVLSRRMR